MKAICEKYKMVSRLIHLYIMNLRKEKALTMGNLQSKKRVFIFSSFLIIVNFVNRNMFVTISSISSLNT